MHVHCPPPPGTCFNILYDTFVPPYKPMQMHVQCPPPPGTVLTFNSYDTLFWGACKTRNTE